MAILTVRPKSGTPRSRRSEYAEYSDWAWGKRPLEEFYDLKADPHQMNNWRTATNIRL